MTKLPDWLVERAALDEVPSASRGRLEQAAPEELSTRVAALREDNARELAAYPADPAVAQIEARMRETPRRRRRTWIAPLVVAGLAAGAILLIPHTRSSESEEPETTRVKGAVRLQAFKQTGDHAERLHADDAVRAGDVIQLRYNAGGARYGMIASIDGAGGVTLHYPASPDAATDVESGTHSVPEAFSLDDAPRFERFFFITSSEPLEVAGTLDSLRALARRGDAADAVLDLPPAIHQVSLRLRKP